MLLAKLLLLHRFAVLDTSLDCLLLIQRCMFVRNEVNIEMAVDRSSLPVFSDYLLFHIKHNSDFYHSLQKTRVSSLGHTRICGEK